MEQVEKVVAQLAGVVGLPKMARVRQIFDKESIPARDIPALVQSELSRADIRERIAPGMHVGIACGSRGLANLQAVMRAIVDYVAACGAFPFVFHRRADLARS